MQYSIKLKASPHLIEFFKNPSPKVEKYLNKAIKNSLILVQRNIQKKTPRRTGDLQRSIQFNVQQRKVFTNLFYSLFVEKGVVIKPNKKKALRWFEGGRAVFAKRVKVKPRRFFYTGAKEVYEKVLDIFGQTFRELLERLG